MDSRHLPPHSRELIISFEHSPFHNQKFTSDKSSFGCWPTRPVLGSCCPSALCSEFPSPPCRILRTTPLGHYTTNGLGHLLAEDLAYRGPSPRPRGEALGGLGPCPGPRPLTSRVLAIFQNYEIKKSCVSVIFQLRACGRSLSTSCKHATVGTRHRTMK